MEIFGLGFQDLIFSLFLPFLFFSLLIYILLKKSKILGEQTERLNILLALIISALGIFSLYYMGLTTWLPYLAAFLALAAFLLIYFYGIGNFVLKKMDFYGIEKNEKKKFDTGVENCKKIWESFERETNPEKKIMFLGEMKSEVEKLKSLAEKLGMDLYSFDWYKKYNEIISKLGES
ncbi:MAG: hypothetical protein QW423_01160 [Candidatus Aenigmatarchaeota archaeon]